jgi:hypothetical protein
MDTSQVPLSSNDDLSFSDSRLCGACSTATFSDLSNAYRPYRKPAELVEQESYLTSGCPLCSLMWAGLFTNEPPRLSTAPLLIRSAQDRAQDENRAQHELDVVVSLRFTQKDDHTRSQLRELEVFCGPAIYIA